MTFAGLRVGKQKRISMSLLVGECSGTCVFAGRGSCASTRQRRHLTEKSLALTSFVEDVALRAHRSFASRALDISFSLHFEKRLMV